MQLAMDHSSFHTTVTKKSIMRTWTPQPTAQLTASEKQVTPLKRFLKNNTHNPKLVPSQSERIRYVREKALLNDIKNKKKQLV